MVHKCKNPWCEGASRSRGPRLCCVWPWNGSIGDILEAAKEYVEGLDYRRVTDPDDRARLVRPDGTTIAHWRGGAGWVAVPPATETERKIIAEGDHMMGSLDAVPLALSGGAGTATTEACPACGAKVTTHLSRVVCPVCRAGWIPRAGAAK